MPSKPFEAAQLVLPIRQRVASLAGANTDDLAVLALPNEASAPEPSPANCFLDVAAVGQRVWRLGGRHPWPRELKTRLHKLNGCAGRSGALALRMAATRADAACRNRMTEKTPFVAG